METNTPTLSGPEPLLSIEELSEYLDTADQAHLAGDVTIPTQIGSTEARNAIDVAQRLAVDHPTGSAGSC